MSKNKFIPLYKVPSYVWGINEPLPARTTVGGAFHRMLWRLCGYNQFGLFHDDVLYNYPDVLEAVRRLPPEIQDERNYRLIRAVQLSLERIRLPEEQWTKYEDDCTIGRYMTPYLEEVRREIKEQDMWNATH